MALNTQLSQRKDDQKTKQETATIKRKTPYIYTQKEENQENSEQPRQYSYNSQTNSSRTAST